MRVALTSRAGDSPARGRLLLSIRNTTTARRAAALVVTLAVFTPARSDAQAQRQPPPPGRGEAPEDADADEPETGAHPYANGLEGRDASPAPPGARVQFSLEDGDLEDLVRMMTSITGRRFILTGTQRNLRATIASTEPVTAAEAWRAFLAILHQNGMTAIRRGRHWMIADSENMPREPTSVLEDGSAVPSNELFVTFLHHVEHVPVADVAQLLDGLRSSDGQILTYAPTSTVILIDTGANIRRMRRILTEVDVARGDAHVWIEPLHFADAEQTAEQLRAIFEDDASPTRASAPTPTRASPRRATPAAQEQAATTVEGSAVAVPQLYRLIPEPRTNALIIVATDAGYRRVIALLRELDREDGAEATVHVHRLQHGDSTNVAATLQSLLGQSGGAAASAGQAGQGQAVAGLRDRVRVEAHADLNALVVTSTPSDWRTVRRLIDELDAPPRQVFLEMVVMELSVDTHDQLNLNVLSGLADIFGSGLVGLVSGGGGAIDAADLLSGIAFGISGDTVVDPRLPGGSAPSFGVLLQAISGSENANIISTPHVLALDNREANINIGQSVPLQGSNVPSIPSILTGSTQASDAANVANSFTNSSGGGRRDTGTIIAVTPHVNDDGEIRLEIRAEDSRQAGVSAGNLNAATFNQSIAETELIARDGQTVVIGGLMRDAVEVVRTGVPILSDIPILGALFGSTEHHNVKRNLLFFVTPYIVRGPADLRAIFERRLRERRELLDRHRVFGGDEWQPPVDWSRTRGLVGEILDRFVELDREHEAAAEPPPAAPEHVVGAPLDEAAVDSP